MDTRYDIVILDSVPSTQDVAASRLADSGVPCLVITGYQTGGRGRSGRRWLQADRGVAASIAVAPRWDPGSWGLIPLATGIAVRRAISGVTGLEVGLKWPNDLVTAGGKVGGILAEASGGAMTVGCGINLWWPEAPDAAAALFASDPGSDLGGQLAAAWAGILLDILDAPAEDWPRLEYAAASVTIGAEVWWDGGRGRGRGIAADGGLIVDTGSGSVVLHSGEVHLLR